MSYCVSLMNYDFTIKNQNKPGALLAMHNFERAQAEKSKFYRVGKQFNTLEEQMAYWYWQVETNEAGDIVEISLENERLGEEDQWFDAIAPYVEPGSYIDMEGEDGYVWRYYFDGEHCEEYSGVLIFPGCPKEDD